VPATYLETREIPLKDLTPFPGNARRGNVPVIRESIRTNGQYRSLIVRQTDDALTILAGNHTKEALEGEGRSFARCEVIECDDETAKKIVLADNRAADLGDYEQELLRDLLDDLDDLEGTGYTPDDLDDLFAETESVPETAFRETQATWSETAEEMSERRDKVESFQSQEARGIRETIIILPQDQHDELHRHLAGIRKSLSEGDLTNGELVLRCARALAVVGDVHASHDAGCDCEWCKVVLKTADLCD
jgi:hypothetical protein